MALRLVVDNTAKIKKSTDRRIAKINAVIEANPPCVQTATDRATNHWNNPCNNQPSLGDEPSDELVARYLPEDDEYEVIPADILGEVLALFDPDCDPFELK